MVAGARPAATMARRRWLSTGTTRDREGGGRRTPTAPCSPHSPSHFSPHPQALTLNRARDRRSPLSRPPAIPAAPRPGDTATSSAGFSSTSPCSESKRDRPNPPHRPLLPRLRPPSPSTDASPSFLPRRCRPRARASGELRLLLRLSSLPLTPCAALSPCATIRRRH